MTRLLLILTMLLAPLSAWADQYVRQSTASQEVVIGPFVDDTDFKTAETALTIANTDVKVLKAGATTEVNKTSGGGTHLSNGRYLLVLDATDTNTLGSMRISIKMTGALEVWENIHVLSPTAFDYMFSASTSSIETAVNSIKAKTDSLTFDGGNVNSNVEAVNNHAVGGDGTAINPWGPQ